MAENKWLVLENGKKIINKSIAILIVLYYDDELDYYMNYIKNVPNDIIIYIISSNASIIEREKDFLKFHKKTYMIKKQNRGRDLSGLLVAFHKYIEQYEYICFLHDKMPKYDYLVKDVNLWLDNLWGNMLFSEGYIWSAIHQLKDCGYGILLPPQPVGSYMDTMYTDPWNDDYENAVKLALEIGVQVPIEKETMDIVSIGSVFWGRTDALKKLWSYEWKYSDFPEEPMPDDGTISHAIERILGFVAIDAGYKVGTIVSPQYAAIAIEMLQEKMQMTYKWLWENLGVKNTYQLENFNREQKIIEEMFTGDKNVYLYGAGNYGVKYLQRLIFWGYRPKGYVVSDGHRESMYCQGFPVKELHELKDERDVEIIITTNPQLQNIIATQLEKIGISYYKAIIV